MWAKLDDQYADHPKIVRVGPLGMALHTAATCYCARYLTDGFIPSAMIARLINLDGIFIANNGVTNPVTHEELTIKLTEVGLFDEVPGGYMVHDYLEYNPPAEQVKAERERNKARQAAWKEKRVSNAGSNAGSNAVNNNAPSPSPSPSQYPEEEKEREEEGTTTPASIKPPNTHSSGKIILEPDAENIYRKVTGHMSMPSLGKDDAIRIICDIARVKGDETDAYLSVFYKEYITRQGKDGRTYSPTGFGWLDWAVTGKIPEKRSSPVGTNGQKLKKYTDADGNPVYMEG